MAAYYKVEVSLGANAVTVGIPSPQTVNVVLPLVGPAGPQGAAGAAGATGAQGPQGVPGTGLEVLTTQGDLLYQGASTGERLPIGSEGEVLKVESGVPAWGAAGEAYDQSLNVADDVEFNKVVVGDSELRDGEFQISDMLINFSSLLYSGNEKINFENNELADGGWKLTDGPLDFTGDNAATNAATTRTNLGLGTAAIAASTDFAAASHAHGNLTNDGKVGTTANLPLRTGTNGVVEAGAFGTAAASFCEGNDARLSDDRDPMAILLRFMSTVQIAVLPSIV
jgi:hypothetical protein